MANQEPSTAVKFGTAGLGGCMAWLMIHPANTMAVRMNLEGAANPGKKLPGFVSFIGAQVREKGIASAYSGLGAGMLRQVFYATSRFGLFEVYRDMLKATGTFSPKGEVNGTDRLLAGLGSGACAAFISCPAEVSLVRMSTDTQLPPESRRNYKNVADAASRIIKEEGISTFWRGSAPFVQRAMLVGVCQVGTLDQGKEIYERKLGIMRGTYMNVFCAAMTSGLLYSLITMPFESCKNRMAFQKPDPNTGKLMYTSTVQTMKSVAAKEGVLSLWNGFFPYYTRCGGHTVLMFVFVDMLRNFAASK